MVDAGRRGIMVDDGNGGWMKPSFTRRVVVGAVGLVGVCSVVTPGTGCLGGG